jgi:hypothetical protein
MPIFAFASWLIIPHAVQAAPGEEDNIGFNELKIAGEVLGASLWDKSNQIIGLIDEAPVENQSELITDVSRRRQICGHLEDLGSLQLQFTALNIANDKILQYATNDDLEYLPAAAEFKTLFPSLIVHQLISAQNELYRVPGFCESSQEVIQLDFDYVVLSVQPDNIVELAQSLYFLRDVGALLKDHFSNLQNSPSRLNMAPTTVATGECSALPLLET